MDDRELLELSAKAAGIDAQWDCPERGMMILTEDGIDTRTWNPLTDDGDALRLAVMLGMDVDVTGVGNKNGYTFAMADADNNSGAVENFNDDPYAATRRAIVCAAVLVVKTK